MARSEFGHDLESSYFWANVESEKRGRGRLPKYRFMQQIFPGRYKNKKSAQQAYRRVTKGETSGARLAKEGHVYRTPILDTIGQATEGLWMVVVTYAYRDSETDEWITNEGSFILESMEYTRMLDVPLIEQKIDELAREHVQYWISHGSPPNAAEAIIIEIQVKPIARSNIMSPSFFPGTEGPTYGTSGQRRISLDELDVEDYENEEY